MKTEHELKQEKILLQNALYETKDVHKKIEINLQLELIAKQILYLRIGSTKFKALKRNQIASGKNAYNERMKEQEMINNNYNNE